MPAKGQRSWPNLERWRAARVLRLVPHASGPAKKSEEICFNVEITTGHPSGIALPPSLVPTLMFLSSRAIPRSCVSVTVSVCMCNISPS